MNLEWQFGEPITQATLSQIESQLGVSFPQDFAEVILDHSGAYPSLSTFDYPGHSGAVFNNLISFDLTSELQHPGDPGPDPRQASPSGLPHS
jgi:cell wall assembly regulator SMI1